MNIKIDEVMSAYANILSELPEQSAPDALWHSTVNFPDATPDLDVGQISLQTNAFISTAMDKKEQDTVREKLTPVELVDMIEEAHPEPVYIADAMADGGLVENQNELHQKLIEMINKYPSGSIGHKYAALIEDLLIAADQLDASGNPEAANELDSLASEIADTIKKNSSLSKQAVFFVPVLIGAAILGGGAGLVSAINGMQENLQKDAQDLADNISGWVGDSEYTSVRAAASQALGETRSLVGVSRELMAAVTDLSRNRSPELAARTNDLQAEVNRLIEGINSNLKTVMSVAGSGKTGLDFSITSSKLNDLNESHERITNAISGSGTQAQQPDPFDSPEMESATRIADEEGSDELEEITAKQPLDKNATVQAQLFINRAYKPIGVANGVIDEVWYLGIKALVKELRERMQSAVAVQDQEAAANVAMDMNISKFVQMDNDGNYSLLVSAVDFNKLLNLADTVESQAQAAMAVKHPPHASFL